MRVFNAKRRSPRTGRGLCVSMAATNAAVTLRIVAIGLAALLAGCATFSPDGGMSTVQDVAGAALDKRAIALRSQADVDAARDAMRRRLKRTLTADAAVELALLGNRDLQASYNALGMSEAVMVAASLPPNPGVSISGIAGGGGLEIERQIVANVLALATLPARAEIAADRFHAAQLRAALDTLRVAAEARRAYYRTVAAGALAKYLGEAQSTAASAAQLSRRLGESGALNKLDQARHQVFYADLTAELAGARRRATSERERLIRAIGLWGGDLDFRLPDALPPLPAVPRVASSVEIEAVRRRVELQIGRIEIEALAKSYGLTSATRFIDLLEVSGIAKTARDPGGPRYHEYGAGIDLQVPLFDFGQVRVRQAEETYMRAVNRLTAEAVNARSEAREAYQAYRATYDIARHYRREVLPLRKIVSDETQLRYNAMQIDVFALLAEARQSIAATQAAIRAEEDFWLADADLGTAIFGGGSNGATANPPLTATADAAAGRE
jgi:outer membrane protein TolC